MIGCLIKKRNVRLVTGVNGVGSLLHLRRI